MGNEKSTTSIEFLGGVPLTIPNKVILECKNDINYKGVVYKGFYISYNNRDASIYGDRTTALVIGQGEIFLILNGNHIKEYTTLANNGFDACLNYFNNNKEKQNKYSD